MPEFPAGALCLSHFLEHTLERAHRILSGCRDDRTIQPADLDWLSREARYVLQVLLDRAPSDQRERVLELLLCLSNLNSYFAHHSFRNRRPG